MQEKDSSVYFDQLADFVAINNTRVKRMTRLAQKSVDQSNILSLNLLFHTNCFWNPKIKIGHNFCIRSKVKLPIEAIEYRQQKSFLKL